MNYEINCKIKKKIYKANYAHTAVWYLLVFHDKDPNVIGSKKGVRTMIYTVVLA